MVRSGVAVASAAVVTLAACGGSTPAPAPTPSAVPLRAIEVCAATVVVPDDSVSAVPTASSPPTVTLAIGEALSFAIPRGARVGLLGASQPDDDATVCTVTTPMTGTQTLVAVAAGYLRIGAQVGIGTVATLLVKVTTA